jgi:midasin
MKQLLACLLTDERALLVGPTGEGKTTLVQEVARIFGKKLFVYNMNQGSDSVDLVGGFKPLNVAALGQSFITEFINLFQKLP